MGGSLRNKDLFRFLPVGLGAFFLRVGATAFRRYLLSNRGDEQSFDDVL